MGKKRSDGRRDHTRYDVHASDGTWIDCGITRRELTERERERQRKHGDPGVTLRKIGRKVSKQTAREWERQRRCSPYSNTPEQGTAE